MSKGDWQRPMDKKKFDEGFEAIFGKKEIKTWNPEEDEPFFDRLDKIDKIIEEANDEQEIDVQSTAEGTRGSGVGSEDRHAHSGDTDCDPCQEGGGQCQNHSYRGGSK